ALMAGLGGRRLLAEPGDPSEAPRAWRRTAILLGLLALLAAIATSVFPAAWAPFVRWGAIKGALAVALVLVLDRLSGRVPPRPAALVLVAGVAADLAVAAW